jgi:coenzyme F420-reducing hydrogenase delta subunit
MPNDFEPHIIAFACHYCAYGAADLAGSMRLSYPEGIRVVKLPCTGKIDVLLVLDAFEHGADGVMVAG